MPTTPFVLLAATCFIKGSTKIYDWLLKNSLFSNIINSYTNKSGIRLKTKVYAISLLWLSIISSIVFFINKPLIEIILLLVASCVTLHLIRIKTLDKNIYTKYNKKNMI